MRTERSDSRDTPRPDNRLFNALAERAAMGAFTALLLLAFSCFAQPPKGQLPSGWGKLGLSDEQKKAIYTVQAATREEVSALQAKIDALKAKERSQLFDLLTDAQKARLRELKLGNLPEPKKKDS